MWLELLLKKSKVKTNSHNPFHWTQPTHSTYPQELKEVQAFSQQMRALGAKYRSSLLLPPPAVFHDPLSFSTSTHFKKNMETFLKFRAKILLTYHNSSSRSPAKMLNRRFEKNLNILLFGSFNTVISPIGYCIYVILDLVYHDYICLCINSVVYIHFNDEEFLSRFMEAGWSYLQKGIRT